TMEIRDWYFSCRNQKIVPFFKFKYIFGEFRQLPGSCKATTVNDLRRHHLCIAMLIRMQIHHEADQCTLQTRSNPFIKHESASCNLGSPFKIEYIQFGCNIPM